MGQAHQFDKSMWQEGLRDESSFCSATNKEKIRQILCNFGYNQQMTLATRTIAWQ